MKTDKNRIWYEDSATVAKFLLGGIGTGNVSVGSRGQLCDWELFNSQNVGGMLPYSFFALRIGEEGKQPTLRMLESQLRPPHERVYGYAPYENTGIPRFERARLAGEVSRAIVELRDSRLPVEVDLNAFSPFVPLDTVNSGIPAAVFRYTVHNIGDAALQISLVGSLSNAVGYIDSGGFFGMMRTEGEPQNICREEDGVQGLYFDNPNLPAEHLTNGSMALTVCGGTSVTAKKLWFCSSHWDGAHEFWSDFEEDGKLKDVPADVHNLIHPTYDSSRLRTGSICTDFSLDPDESRKIEFILSWHFPNRPARWLGHIFDDEDNGNIRKNYYSTYWKDAWEVSSYLHKNLSKLERESDEFREAFYQTTLPSAILDAMSSNITTLRSTTCFRLEDGTFLGWEGGFENSGCCEGNCSHVWNYQQTMAFLFPELERNMRRTQFLMETGEDGEMAYRANTMFGFERFTKIPPCADGQPGTIAALYRDWKLSGDDDFLREMWYGAVRALEYVFSKWDKDGDFVLEAEQHNTYDIEFYGANSLTNSIFYAALKAAEEMASYLGEHDRAERYRTAYEAGAARMDSMLFNGEYYIQKVPENDEHLYQYHEGCLSDQVLGQQLAHISGLGYILPKEHVQSAVKSVFRYNFREDMSEHVNVQRVYALNDDAGLINCSWPNGEKPIIPFIYSDEVWTGIEYQVATHLIYEGYYDDALTIVKAVRSRYDGVKRNPWNEVECGNHYVRGMASWGLLLAASGFRFDMTEGKISFAPVVSEDDFTCFFSTAKCWGLYRQKRDATSGKIEREIEVLYGDGEGIRLV